MVVFVYKCILSCWPFILLNWSWRCLSDPKKFAQIIGNDYVLRMILVLLELKMTIMEKVVAVMIWTHLFSNNILNIVIRI